MGVTDNPKNPCLKKIKSDGQQICYLVLSDEERAKDFVRPVRRSYKHVGIEGPRYSLRDLTEEELSWLCGNDSFVKFEDYPDEMKVQKGMGRYWTQAQLDSIGKGCGTVTSIGQAIAETHACDPSFYGSTFCVQCGEHFPVGVDGEFIWIDDGTRVGT